VTDERTFTLAYAHHYPQVERFLRGMLAGRGDAPDLAQEVFLRLHARGPAAAGEAQVRFWLFRVARNLALNELRRWTLRDAMRPLLALLAAPQPTPHDALVRDEDRRRLLAHLAKLSADQRAALLLREWEEMSYDEIAATLEVSVAKVKSDLFRARQALRAAWENER